MDRGFGVYGPVWTVQQGTVLYLQFKETVRVPGERHVRRVASEAERTLDLVYVLLTRSSSHVLRRSTEAPAPATSFIEKLEDTKRKKMRRESPMHSSRICRRGKSRRP